MKTLVDLVFLSLPFRKKEEKVVQPPRVRGFLLEVHDAIERGQPFALVYIRVERGDAQYVCNLVGGKLANARSIGVIVPDGAVDSMYAKLDCLDESRLRIGVAHYDPSSPATRGELLVKVQDNYVTRTYSKSAAEAPLQPSYA